jgi:outer membrane protein TolC
MPQNHSMKRIGILSAFFAAVAAVVAQGSGEFTPVPPPSQSQTGAQPVSPPRMPLPPATAGTNAPAGRVMSLPDCIQAALAHNFDVQVQRYNPQISLYNLDAAYSGYDPTFSASGTHSYNVSPGGYNPYSTNSTPPRVSDMNSFNSGISGTLLPWGLQYDFSGNISEQYGSSGTPFDNSSGSIGVTLAQPLLKNFWIDSTRLNIRVAKNRLQYSEQGLRQQLITSVTAVANAYYELIYAQQNVQVQQEALALAQTQLDQDNQRVQIGTLAILSVQQDESQAAQSKANLIAAQSTLDTDQNALKNLLTDNYSQWHDTDIQPAETLTAPPQTFDLQDSWTKGMAKRPDLLQARLNVEQWGIQLKYYRNQLLPEVDLTGSYGFNGASREFSGTFGQFNQGNSPFYSYGAKLSVPLGNLGPRNQYKATKATLQQIELQFKQLEQNILVQIDNAVKQAESAYQSAEATKQARIYAEAALDAETKTYAVGKATTFEVLTYQNNLTAARSQEIRALANYNEALASLAAQEGTTLERYNINLEAK